jgi:aminodeoxyfutalosine synthase
MATQLDRLAGSDIADLLTAIQSGEPLSASACLRLWRTRDLTSLGSLANLRREQRSGQMTFFRPVIHLNYTGRPVPACPLCSHAASRFARQEWEDSLISLDPEVEGELHLTGGPDSSSGVSDLCNLIAWVRELRPRLQIRGFTWGELERAAEKDRIGPVQVLKALVEAGLSSLLGGALADLTPARPGLSFSSIQEIERRSPWIEAAAQLNLRSELSWIYGDDDDPEVLVETLVRIRALQDRWGVFECCTPLLFDWPSEEIEIPMATGYNQLRAIAVARLFLDSVARIRSCWRALTESVMQVAQWYGADDAGCAALWGRAALPGQVQSFGSDELKKLIRAAGRDPVNALSG